MIDPTSAPGPRPDMKESAAALLSCITRMGGHSNRFHELSSVYSDLRLTLFAHDINIRLETSNLVSMPGIAFPTIALNELDLSGVEDAKRTRIEGYKGTSGMPTLMSASRSGNEETEETCSICIPLRSQGSTTHPSTFGGLIAIPKLDRSDPQCTQSIDIAIQLADALSTYHTQQLREFVSVVTSLLLSPVYDDRHATATATTTRTRTTRPQSPVHEEDIDRSPLTAFLYTDLGPLPTTTAPMPLPKINRFTLRFRDPWLEREFHEWRAASMGRLDAWSLTTGVMLIATLMAVPSWARAAIYVAIIAVCSMACILSLAPTTTGRALIAWYRPRRDGVMAVGAAVGLLCSYFMSGSIALRSRLVTVVPLLFQSQLTWQVPHILVALVLRCICTSASAWQVVRLVGIAACIPLAIVYIMEVVSRRAFLGRQAILEAEAAAEEEEEDDDDWLYDDVEL